MREKREGIQELESFNEAWELICDYCKGQITEVAFNTWFARIEPVEIDFDQGVATLQAPNIFHKQTLEKGYNTLLTDAVHSVFGPSMKWKLCLKEEIADKKPAPQVKPDYELNFENFVVGPSNRFAHAACLAVASKPSVLYNPLFIYGHSGLGKTHLLRAISKEIKDNFPSMVIVYIKGESFTNELIEAIRTGTTAAFRDKYRHADVLLVDDIQFIGGKESTQEEFFHTFNSLHESHKQIILTSDRPPKEISTLEERLRTRFEWGLTADIQPPDFETRIAIITRKAESINLNLPDNVCEYVANQLKNNIRQLEGAVKKIGAMHLVEHKPINVTTAQSAISDIINNDQPAPITVERIIEEVARTYGVSPEDIFSKKRKAAVSTARQISMYISREITDLALTEIGKIIGNRDHSTVVYAIKQVEINIIKDTYVKNTIDDIIKNIQSL